MARRPRGTGWGVQAWLSCNLEINRTGNWSKSGPTVTLTSAVAHGLQPGFGVHVVFAGTGAPTSDFYTVVSTPNSTTFTITVSSGTGTNGTFSNHLTVWDSFNISKVYRLATGTIQVFFETPFANQYYSVASTPVARAPGGEPSQHTMVVLTDVPTAGSAILRNVTSSNFTADLAYMSAQFCGRQ